MIYVDKGLCTGCGICLPACDRGALSLNGNAAAIDESLCASCGRCIDTCLTGAIISMEVIPQSPLPAPAQHPEAQPVWAGAPSLSLDQAAAAFPATPQTAAISKLELLEKAFSGLFAIATYALDRKRGRSSWLAAAVQKPGDTTASTGSGGRGCAGGQRRHGTNRGQGLGRDLGGGRGPGASGGERRRMNRRNRAT